MPITHDHLQHPNQRTDSSYLFSGLDVAINQGDPDAVDREAAALVSSIQAVKDRYPDKAPRKGGEKASDVIGRSLGTASVWSAMRALEVTPTEATQTLAQETVTHFQGPARAVYPKAFSLTLNEGVPFSDALDIVTGKSPSSATENNDPNPTVRRA